MKCKSPSPIRYWNTQDSFMMGSALILFTITCLIPIERSSGAIRGNQSSLKLLHVLMRHGDRTPFHVYPNDPYSAKDFHPVPVGELTNSGKNRAYNVGLTLRRTYHNFLGNFYSSLLVKAISSPFSRCMNSVALVVNAMFPPISRQRGKFGGGWHPISCEINKPLFLVYKHCPNFKIFQDQHATTNESREAFQPLEEVIRYVREHSGDFDEKYVFGYNIYSTLLAESEMGLPVPKWASTIFPDTLANIAKTEIDQMYRGKNKILGSAYIMEKIVKDTIATLEGAMGVRGMKLYIYSGHDMNIVALLSWLDVYEPHLPNYSAYIVLEIHIIDGEDYIKILYNNHETKAPIEINIPNCGFLCPFKRFIMLYEHQLEPNLYCGL